MVRIVSRTCPGLVFVFLLIAACTPANVAPGNTPGAPATRAPQSSPTIAEATPDPTFTATASPTAAPSPTLTASPTMVVNPATMPRGEWILLGKMPSARSEMPAVSSGGLIYVAGGFGNPGMDRGNVVYPLAHGKALEIFDPHTNLWQEAAPMPGPRHHLQATANDGRIYVFGGAGVCPPECGFQDTAWTYDPEADTWTELAPMPFAVSAGAAVSLPEGLYLLGGLPDTAQALLRYDPATGEWHQQADMLEASEHVAAAAY